MSLKNKNYHEFKSASDIKIAIYAISKNEAKFAHEWLLNMANSTQLDQTKEFASRGADYVCVLDTGSTDDTESILRSVGTELQRNYGQFSPTLIISSTDTFSPENSHKKQWRFDLARNESMKLIPEAADVCVCVDLDERLDPAFWSALRQTVYEHPNFCRIYYKYAWSHYPDGSPDRVFWYDKIHTNKIGPAAWHWEYPVHETLTFGNVDESSLSQALSASQTGEYYLDDQIVFLHHFPDTTKSRGSYLPLLELRAEEYPNDLYGLCYLANEYEWHGEYQKALDVCFKVYSHKAAEETDDYNLVAATEIQIARLLQILNPDNYRRSLAFLEMAMHEAPNNRDAYIEYALIAAAHGQAKKALDILNEMISRTTRTYDWREMGDPWTWKQYYAYAFVNGWLGNLPACFGYCEMAKLAAEKNHNSSALEDIKNVYDWAADQFSSSGEKGIYIPLSKPL